MVFCYSHLLPDYKKKFKTKVFKDSTTPQWNEKFVFEKLKLEDLRSNRVIELTVWDLVKSKQYDFIGGLRIGPRPHHDTHLPYMDSSDTELSHWMSVIDTPGHAVEKVHTLRHNMDPRTVTIATSEPSGIDESAEVTSQNVVTVGSVPQDHSTPRAAMVQPTITISGDQSPTQDRRGGYHSNEHSPLRTPLKSHEDDETSSTPSHQVIHQAHPHYIT